MRGDCRQHCAEELAIVALELYGFPLTEPAILAVAAHLYGAELVESVELTGAA